MSQHQDNSNTLVAILAGVALGAAAGILFAPEKGSKTRGKLKGNFDDAKTRLKGDFEKTKSRFASQYESKKHDVEGSYETLLSNLSHKAEDAINYLENKLADLKKQNAKLQK